MNNFHLIPYGQISPLKTWQVDIICHKKELNFQLFFYLFSPIFACVYDIDIFKILWYIEYVNYQEISEHTFLIIYQVCLSEMNMFDNI